MYTSEACDANWQPVKPIQLEGPLNNPRLAAKSWLVRSPARVLWPKAPRWACVRACARRKQRTQPNHPHAFLVATVTVRELVTQLVLPWTLQLVLQPLLQLCAMYNWCCRGHYNGAAVDITTVTTQLFDNWPSATCSKTCARTRKS